MIAIASKLACAPVANRFPRLVVLATIAVVVVGLALLLRAEHQVEVAIVLIAFVALLLVLEKTSAGSVALAAMERHSATANAMAFAGALGLIASFHDDHYVLLMIATVALYATASAGLTLQMAFAGVANFAGAAFFSVGGYAAALLAAHTGLPHLLILLLGGCAAGLLGLVLLLPALRTRGHYAALVTIAFGILLRSFLEVNDELGGPQGLKIPGLDIFGIAFNKVSEIGPVEVSFYLPYAVLAVLILAATMFLMRRLDNSWLGIGLDAVRGDEIAASTFGLNGAGWKAAAFVAGNVLIGVAGATYGMMNGFVNPLSAGFAESLLMISIIVLGGLGNLWGAVAASVVILVIPEKLQAIQEYRLLIFAILVILILRFRPKGLLPRPLRNLSRFSSRSGTADD
jgi:ABC-type branched-subunit amino acid transport system permease subunit